MGRVRVRVYKADTLSMGPLEMRVFRLEQVIDLGSGVDVFDVLTEYSERYSNTPEAVVEVVEMNERTREEKRVAVYTSGKGKLLFQRPALLRRAAIIDGKTASHASPTPLETLETVTPKGEVYVYVGDIKSSKPVWGVLLETDKGVRFIRLARGVTRDSNSDAGGG